MAWQQAGSGRARDSRTRVLRALHERGPLAKKDLQFLCDLSRPTVDKVLRDLRAWGLVEPDGYRASSGGRRSTLYKFNERCRYVLGVDLEIPQLNLVICDLLGRVVHRRRRRLPLHRGDGPETLIPFVADQILRFVKRVGLSLDDLLGIGFGAPGTVSAPAAQRDATPTLSFWGETLPPWRDVPVQALLEEALEGPVRVCVGNDVAFMALAEGHLLRRAQAREREREREREPVRVLAYVALRRGAYGDVRMGGAVLVDGRIYRGEHGHAVSLREAYVQLGEPEGGEGPRALEALLAQGLEAVEQGDVGGLRRVLEEHLLVPMLNLVTLFDPGRLVIQARLLGREEEAFVRSCARWLRVRLGERFAVRVARARGGEWAGAHGAALAVLQEVFSADDGRLLERLVGGATRTREGGGIVPVDQAARASGGSGESADGRGRGAPDRDVLALAQATKPKEGG